MSKLKSSNSVNVATSKTTTTTAFQSTTTTTKTVKTEMAAAANITNINVNQKEAFLLQQQQQQIKKKRTALENISNAGSNASSSINANKETKKSRFGNAVFGNTVTNVLSKKAAAENVNPTGLAKKPNVASSKENLSGLIPTALNSKAKLNEQKNVQPNSKITKSTCSSTGTSLESSNALSTAKSMSASVISHKNEVKAKDLEAKSEKPVKLESDLERQLATTTISSSSSSSVEEFRDLDEFKPSSSDLIEVIPEELTAEDITGWEDIDADESDEFSANDYVSYIFKYYRERENRFIIDDYIKQQPNINKQMRLLLVDWMVEVQQQLEFNHEVLYLSVKLLDLYLNGRRIEKEKLQLLGGAAMFIACKFEERMPPIIDDFIYVSDNAYDRKELIKMEIDILKTIKFDIGIPLSYTFLRRYSKCIRADMKFLTLARYILELSLQDYNFSYVKDSLKACAALYLAMKMTVAYEENAKASGDNAPLTVTTANLTSTEWNPTLIHYTGSFLKDFIKYVPMMNSLIKTAATSKYKTIFKKYSHQVFYEVAKIPSLGNNDLDALMTA